MLDVVERVGYTNLDLKYQDYMVSFLSKMKCNRKGWSYHGVLPVRVPTDYATRRYPDVFDPSNHVYSCVVRREVPRIQQMMHWAFPPNAELMGDCVESLLAVDDAVIPLEFDGISLHDAAHFFREMSYCTWRIHRVLVWDRLTTNTKNASLDIMLPCNKAVNTKRCQCRNSKVPHDYTMVCAECLMTGCGLEIFLYRDALWCRRCMADL